MATWKNRGIGKNMGAIFMNSHIIPIRSGLSEFEIFGDQSHIDPF